jgi:protein O-mannosyl-transferase
MPRWATFVAAALIVAAGLCAYSNSFRGLLVFDDIGSIAANPHVKSLWPVTRAMSAPQDVTVAGRPVASLTLALNYAIAPADARDMFKPPGADGPPEDDERFYRNIWGYHAFNVAIHLLAALALFGVVRRTVMITGRQGATPYAFAVALVWVVHPLHTEAVTYIVQRVESLMGLFYLLTLYCAIRASESALHPPSPSGYGGARGTGLLQIPGNDRRRRWWVMGAVAACALGMGSKEAMVTAPVAVVLWDWTFGRSLVADSPASDRRPRRVAAWFRWRLYADLAATWSILIALAATNPRPHSAGFGLGGWTWWTSLQTQAGVVAYYLRLAVVPHPLVFDYEWPRAASFMDIAPQALLLVALLGLAVFALARRHALGFVGAWFFLVLAPTSSILPIPTEVAAEHRMYLPAAAVVALVVLSPSWLAGKAGLKARPRRPVLVTAILAALAIAVIFGAVTYARNQDYWTDEGLMRDTVEKRPFNIRARVALGADLLADRRFAEAEAELTVAARLEGSDKAHAQANMYLGSALCAQGKTAEGIAHLRQALALDSSLGEAHALLGEAYAGAGQTALAVEHFRLALSAIPDNSVVLRRVAWLLATSPDAAVRNGAQALELAERAANLTGRRDVIALEALMAAYAEQGQFAEAVATGREALLLAQTSGNTLFVGALQREIALCEAGQNLRDR